MKLIYKAIIKGQCPSGKNAVTTTRTGKRFPNARFKKWREKALTTLPVCVTINEPINVNVIYYAGDKRRRDVPGIIDAIWHLLERGQVVKDDTFLGGMGCDLFFMQEYDKENPRVEITLYKDE